MISPIWCKLLASPQLTGLSLMFCITILIILHMLPQTTRTLISIIIAYPLVTILLLSAIMLIGYYNWIIALFFIVLLAYILLPFSTIRGGYETTTEGFTSKGKDGDNEVPDLSSPEDIKSLFKPGFLRSKLNDARNLTREVNGENAARDKMEKFLDKRLVSSNKHTKERFNNNSGSGAEKAIPQRRFNPGSEEDANLLLTMDIMDDINDRIKYKYEDKKYLKRYIKQKLEEVVDLLGLVNDEDDE